MPLETNFNAAPYFDDFNANNNYHRILFKPSQAVQTRELTQVQTILQDQIEKFGNHIFKDGSVVQGVIPINYDSKIDYIKIKDLDASNNVIAVSSLIGKKVINTANLQALVVNAVDGLESNNPDLKTIYVRYLNSAVYANGYPQKTFDSNELLTVRTTSDVLITNVYSAITDYNSIGKGYAVSTSDGVVYKNGIFIKVEPQTAIISKYSNTPGDISIGFEVNETIVTPEIDSSLYDNAVGAPNFSAPGANRLKIAATLSYRQSETVDTTANTANTGNFFSIVKFQDNAPTLLFTDPQYARLGTELARRTYEESGNYIVDPFEMTVSSNTSNTDALNLEVSRGMGYVYGHRVEFNDKNTTQIRKGIDEVYFPNQIVTGNYGNYVLVNELCGPFDISQLDEVELRDTVSQHLTNIDYTAGGSAPGTKLGTARIRDLQYHSGTPGTPTAQYRMYLFNIQITSSDKNFSDVKSIFANNASSVVAYADTVLNAGLAEVKESASKNMIFSLGQNAAKTINTTSTSYTFRAKATVTFNTSGVATFSPPGTHTGGTDLFTTTGALTETGESKFIIIPTSNRDGPNVASASANVATTSNVIIGNTTNWSSNWQVGDYIRIYDSGSTNNVVRVTSIVNSTAVQIAVNTTFSNTTSNTCLTYPIGTPISLERDDTANINITSTTSGTINLSTTINASMTATLYYDSLRTGAIQAKKSVKKNRLVKINANTHINKNKGPWSLGIADVFKLRAVYHDSGVNYANTNTNRLDKFIFNNNQMPSHYGHAFISLDPSKGYTIEEDGRLLLEFDHFEPDYSTGIGYFSVNSYDIDDANTANTTAIQTAEIPVYRSDTGAVYDLRDCIDFRTYVANTAVSNTVVANATENPATTFLLNINSDGAYSITSDANFNTAFTYYVGRKDKVALSQGGLLNVIEGAPSTSPVTPKDLDGSMTLGVISIPPYPSLGQDQVRTYSRPEYGVDIKLDQYRRYTMKDIGVIDKKINRLEYYTSLSLLEASAKTLNIKDDTGADRFKNGFIVDPFKGFTVADTKNSEFKAAIDYKIQELVPTIKRSYIKLDYDSVNSTNITKTNDLMHLTGNSTTYITQTFASKARNCVENIIYVWNGNVVLDPPGDVEPDLDVNPDVVSNIDLSGLTDIINGLPNVIGVERIVATGSPQISDWGSTFINASGQRSRTITIVNTENTIRNDIDFSASTVTNTFDFGEVVQDVSIQLYMKPKRVKFRGYGLKPNTRVYPFFDNVIVDTYCTPTDSSYVTTGAIGDSFTTDSNGTVYGLFDIPASTFKTGDRIFKLVDISNLVTESETITTQASGSYMGSNISVTKARYKLETRIPEISSSTISTVLDTSFRTSTVTMPVVDPIAQSFFVGEDGNTSGVFVNKIDVYFKSKHSTLGVELQVRYMVNGSPTTRIIPFGRKYLTAAEVNVSEDSSEKTTFTFDAPLYLQSGQEYCFVVMPEGSNDGYNIWVGELGGTDIITNTPIYVNNSTGVLFTSSTNTIWSPFQKEDIKFVIHRMNFNSTSGTIKMTNPDIEFLTVQSIKGAFKADEKVFVSNGTVAVSEGAVCNTTSTSITTNTINLSILANNKHVYITSNTGEYTDVRYVVSANTTALVLNAVPSIADSNAVIGYIASNGGLYGYVSRFASEQGLLYLSNSTANGSENILDYNSNNTIFVGAESRSKANLESINNIEYSVVVPQFAYVTPSETSLTIKTKGHDNSALDSVFTPVTSDIETYFTDKIRVVKSKSYEEHSDSGAKSLQIEIPITTTNSRVSAILDDIKTNMIVIENIICSYAEVTGETAPLGGLAKAKYVTKRVVLAEEQDAEDLLVYLSAYKPANTNIRVYSKLLNGEDSEQMDKKAWTPLNQNTSAAVVSSRINRNDFLEFTYDLPVQYSVNVSSSEAMADYDIYGTFGNNSISANSVAISNTTPLNPGSLIYYVGPADGANGLSNGFYNIFTSNVTHIKFSSPGLATELTVNSSGTSNGTNYIYSVPLTGFKDRYLSNQVSYYTSTGAHYHGYKSFMIKIVMTSDEGSHIVPRISDMRAIALQL